MDSVDAFARILVPHSQSTVSPAEANTGEVIGAYHTYHSNGVLASKLNADLGLSLDSATVANVGIVKHFVKGTPPGSKSQIGFVNASARNIAILIDMQELCENVIGDKVFTDLGFADSD